MRVERGIYPQGGTSLHRLPNAAERRLADAIRAVGTDRFETAMHDWLRRCVAFDNIIALAYFPAARPQMLYSRTDTPAVFAEIGTIYLDGVYLLDPFHDLHVHKAPAGLYRLRDIAPDQFRRSRYFQAYYAKTTLIDEIAFVSYPAPGASVHLCLGRDASSGTAFASREVEDAGRIAPVVIALCELHWEGVAVARPVERAREVDRLIGGLEARAGIRLSPRQAEVALLILRGHSSVSIGLRLGISPQTVKVFRKQLYRKCGISSQAELFALLVPLLGPPGTAPVKRKMG